MSTEGVLAREVVGKVAVLTLNRPDEGNGLTAPLMKALYEAYHEYGHDDAVHAIVVAANGPVWCAGGDHSDLGAAFGHANGNELFYGMGDTGLPAYSRRDQMFDPLGPGRWTLDVHRIEKPLIAAITGSVAGGGLGFLGLHDYRIASSAAEFVPGFVRIGVGPDFGASWFLPRFMGLSAATRFFLGNRPMVAEQALEHGLVHEVVPPSEVIERAMAFALELSELPPLGVRANLRALRATLQNSLSEQLELEWRGQDVVFVSPEAQAALQRHRKGKKETPV